MAGNWVWGGAGSTTTSNIYNLGTNWGPVAGAPPVASGQSAEFSSTGSFSFTVTAGPITPDSWTFDANSQSYTVTGQTVNFGNAATLTNNADGGQAISISNNMTGATLSQAGPSTFVISGTNSFTTTSVSGGTLDNTGSLTSTIGITASGTFTNSLAVTGAVNNAGTFNNNPAGTVSGLLTATGGDTTNAGRLNGGVSLSGGNLSNTGVLNGGITVSSTGTYTQTQGSTNGGLTNSNIVNDNGGTINGIISDLTGGTFNVGGTVTLGATVTMTGAGTLAFKGGSNATIDTTNVSVGTLTLSGGAVVHLGVDLTYAGTFSLAAQADNLFLDGHTLTLSGATTFNGTISGTNGMHDGLVVSGSNIDLSGLFFGPWVSGEDTISLSGTGNADHLIGSSQADTILGSTGNDSIDGGGGTNTVDYSSLTTPGLFAIIQGGGGTVNKGGANGVDTLTNAQDLVDSGTGRSNGDVFEVDAPENVTANIANFNYLIELTAGVNLAYGTNLTGFTEFVSNVGANTVNFASDTHFAYLYGSTGNDTLTLGSGGGYLIGEGGTNILNGGANTTNLFVGGQGGSDAMNGGSGTASNYYYVDGNDQVNGAGAFNTMIGLVSGVTVQLGSAQYQHAQEFVANSGTNAVTVANTDSDFTYLFGGAGNDTLSTGSGGGYMIGEGGTNVLTGGGGINVLVADGGSGVDTMNGGSGSNIYYIDANSTVHGAGTFNTVAELQQNVSLTLGSAQLGTDIQQVMFNGGTNSADFHTATSSVYLYGASGNDTLFGGTGNDFFFGGTGTNTFEFAIGWGHDTIEDWTVGTNNQIDLTALSGLGVHAITDLTQTITSGNDVITSSHTGTNSITLLGVGAALTASSFHFA